MQGGGVLKLVYGRDQSVAKWVAERIPFVGARGFGPCKAIGIVANDGSEIAGVVFHDWQPQFKTIAFSIAAARPLFTRNVVHALLRYPFEDCDVMKLWTATPHRNERAIRFAKGAGFTQEAVLSHHFGKEHAVINRMFLKDYQRLYGVKSGQAFTSDAA